MFELSEMDRAEQGRCSGHQSGQCGAGQRDAADGQMRGPPVECTPSRIVTGRASIDVYDRWYHSSARRAVTHRAVVEFPVLV